MCMELIQLDNHRAILIKETHYPEMYPEFAPGPDPDYKFPDFWNTAVEVFLLDTDRAITTTNPTSFSMKALGPDKMQELYKKVEGSKNRKRYWRVMQYLKSRV